MLRSLRALLAGMYVLATALFASICAIELPNTPALSSHGGALIATDLSCRLVLISKRLHSSSERQRLFGSAYPKRFCSSLLHATCLYRV